MCITDFSSCWKRCQAPADSEPLAKATEPSCDTRASSCRAFAQEVKAYVEILGVGQRRAHTMAQRAAHINSASRLARPLIPLQISQQRL